MRFIRVTVIIPGAQNIDISMLIASKEIESIVEYDNDNECQITMRSGKGYRLRESASYVEEHACIRVYPE